MSLTQLTLTTTKNWQLCNPSFGIREWHELIPPHNKFIVCITKGPGPDTELQATFNHTMLRKSFTDTEPTCVALIGFGNRASAVKVTPKEVFRQSPKIKIPKFSNLIKSDSIEDILALQRVVDKRVDNYAILPPVLMEELFDDEDYSPMYVLLKMIKKARKLIKKPVTISISDDSKDGDTEEKSDEFDGLETEEPELGPNDPDGVEVDELMVGEDTEHPLLQGFVRILDFLYASAVGTKEIKSVHLKVCTKMATARWADEQHGKYLKNSRHSTLPQASNNSVDPKIAQLTERFGTLTDVMTRR